MGTFNKGIKHLKLKFDCLHSEPRRETGGDFFRLPFAIVAHGFPKSIKLAAALCIGSCAFPASSQTAPPSATNTHGTQSFPIQNRGFQNGSASRIHFDLASEFSTNSNPTSNWLFGFKRHPNTDAKLLPKRLDYTSPTGGRFIGWTSDSGTPTALALTSDGSMEQGSKAQICARLDRQSLEYASIRFTAPHQVDGRYRLIVEARSATAGLPDRAVSIYVTQRKQSLRHVLLPASAPISLEEVVALKSGDILEVSSGLSQSLASTDPWIAISISLIADDGSLAPSGIRQNIQNQNLLTPRDDETDVATASESSPIDLGAAAWFPLEKNTRDLVTPQEGRFHGTARFAPTAEGSGLKLAGLHDFISIPHSRSIDVGNSNGMTIEFSASLKSTHQASTFLSWIDSDSRSGGVYVRTPYREDGSIYANLVDTEGHPHRIISPAALLVDQRFHHIAVTYDRDLGVGKMFLDGRIVAERFLGSFSPDTRASLLVGAKEMSNSAHRLSGQIKDVALYRRALSESEIKTRSTSHRKAHAKSELPVPIEARLTCWWEFDSTLTESVSGVITAANSKRNQPGYRAGLIGKAIELGPSQPEIVVPQSQATDLGAQTAFSIELWAKPYTTPSHQPLLEWEEGIHLWLGVDSLSANDGEGNIFFNLVDTAGAAHPLHTPPNQITAGLWHHVTVTYDSSSGIGCIYHNGELVCSEKLGTFRPATSSRLRIGHRAGDAVTLDGKSFWGVIDDVKFYDGALTQEKVRQSFSHQKLKPVGERIDRR